MAKILLNTRASRITIVDGITLLPAEVRKDERLGKVITPSRTLISEEGKPSPAERILGDRACQRLFDAKVLEWSPDKVDEPEKIPNTKGASPYPRIDGSGADAKKVSGSDEADVDHRALIDESGTPLAAVAAQASNDARERGEPTERDRARRGILETDRSSEGERVKTDEQLDALQPGTPSVVHTNAPTQVHVHKQDEGSGKAHNPKGHRGG